ncbi:MAG TPA: hypothetical protein PKC29_00810 [Thermodesulfobacteriota bacterium]|nr:hypothetical protein [Thermodesulfobacteriota bacterium]
MTGAFKKSLLYAVLTLGVIPFGAGHSSAFSGAADDAARPLVQLDPETEQLDQVSEPIGELAEPVEGVPTEELDQVSETDDRASEEIGDDSETAAEASEILPPAPEDEEYGLEQEAPEEEMPLGDREAEGKGLGY